MIFDLFPEEHERLSGTDSMLFYNSKYADRTEKKNYSDHVAKGRRLGKTIEMAVPFGEDRDGDGVIDKRGGSRRR